MLVLVNHGHPTFERHRDPHLGRLVQPRRSYGGVAATARAGIRWAADNDAFKGWGDLQANRWLAMLDAIAGLPGCLFVTVPDVVGDGRATDALFERWAPAVLDRDLPAGYVLQENGQPPWAAIAALFIGGRDDAWKLGPDVAAVVAEAKARGKWVHMGRVNSRQRTLYAKAIGCDSVDGTQTSMFPDRWIPEALRWVREPAPVATWQLCL